MMIAFMASGPGLRHRVEPEDIAQECVCLFQRVFDFADTAGEYERTGKAVHDHETDLRGLQGAVCCDDAGLIGSDGHNADGAGTVQAQFIGKTAVRAAMRWHSVTCLPGTDS